MKTLFEDIKDFHVKFGLEYKGPPRELPSELHAFRSKFMGEELAEYLTELSPLHDQIVSSVHAALPDTFEKYGSSPPLEKQLDALVDLVYVAIGTAYLHGFDFDEAWRRVHKANMKKVRSERKGNGSERGGEYDVVKPEGWTAPDLSDLALPRT